jgi:hypothetical protein
MTKEELEEKMHVCCYVAACAFFVTILAIVIPLHPILAFASYATTILFAFLTIRYWNILRLLATIEQ